MTQSTLPRLRVVRIEAMGFQKGLQPPPSSAKCIPLAICTVVLLLSARAVAGAPATVTFSLDFPASDPAHYSISVDSSGHARYECSARTSPESDERETYQAEFDLTPANRARIFDLAAQAHHFSGKVDSGNNKLAFTGSKKLVYQDGSETHAADYNYSNSPVVQQLTEMFQSIASTLEYGRRMAYFHRYQKLALDEELKRMEIQARNNELLELQAVQPVLKQLFDDASIMNVVRARAQRLIEMGESRAGAGH
jgi:hypothetical protein